MVLRSLWSAGRTPGKESPSGCRSTFRAPSSREDESTPAPGRDSQRQNSTARPPDPQNPPQIPPPPPASPRAHGRSVLTPPGPALTVLVGGEGSGVDVDVGVDLNGGDAQPAGFEDGADAAGDDPFADARDHPARHQDVLHLPAGLTARLRRGRAAPAPPRRPATPSRRRAPRTPPRHPDGAHPFPRAGSRREERTRTPCRRGAQAHEAGARHGACAALLGRMRSAEGAGLRWGGA